MSKGVENEASKVRESTKKQKMDPATAKAVARSTMIAGAKKFSAMDRSDPFTFSRCMAHIDSGIASMTNSDGLKAYYDADPYQSPREYLAGETVVKYSVVDYRNVVRP